MNSILNPKAPFARLVTDLTDVGIRVKYIGIAKGASIEVAAATGDITFKVGTPGILAVDTTVVATTGIIDTSSLTLGAVVDTINGSINWKAYVVDGLRSDSADNALTTKAETVLSIGGETNLLKDNAVTPFELAIRVGSRTKVNGTEELSAAEIYSITSVNTFASGTNLIKIYEVDELEKTEVLKYSLAGGVTTAENTKTFVNNGRGSFATSKTGTHLVVKMVGSVTATGSLQVVGATAK